MHLLMRSCAYCKYDCQYVCGLCFFLVFVFVFIVCFFFVFFFFKQKTAYEMLRSLVGSEMCIRDRSKRYFEEMDFGIQP